MERKFFFSSSMGCVGEGGGSHLCKKINCGTSDFRNTSQTSTYPTDHEKHRDKTRDLGSMI